MPSKNDFRELIGRVRAGDEQAAHELFRQYEPVVRLEVRLRLWNPRVRRLLESADICQLVLLSFFVRARDTSEKHRGWREQWLDRLDQPQDLLKLLVWIARNKLRHQVRQVLSPVRHPPGNVEVVDPYEWEVPAHDPGPDQVVAEQELLRDFRERLNEEEQRLWDLYAQRRDWDDIARELGGTPQARRKQLERARDRVLRELGVGGDDDE